MIKRGNWHDNKVPIYFVTVQYNFLLCVDKQMYLTNHQYLKGI